jgi:hypothetical protein
MPAKKLSREIMETIREYINVSVTAATTQSISHKNQLTSINIPIVEEKLTKLLDKLSDY